MSEREMVAEAFPPGDFIRDELEARGWTTMDAALRMGGKTNDEIGIDCLTLDMVIDVPDPNLIICHEFAGKLGRAFGVSPDFFLNMARVWREWNLLGGQQRLTAAIDGTKSVPGGK